MLTTLNYEGSPIQFEVIEGQVMANATAMAKAFGKKPDDIFKTKTWVDFECAVIEDLSLRFEDIRTVKNGDAGGSWIHQELVLEFSRRLNTKFSLWCNRMIAELLRTGSVSIKKLTPAEILLAQAQQLVNHERQISELQERQSKTEAAVVEIVNNMQTRPDYFCISAFCALHGIRISNKTAQRIGKLAAAKCKLQGYEIGSVKDEKWGKVGSYPAVVLKDVFTDEGFGVSRIAA